VVLPAPGLVLRAAVAAAAAAAAAAEALIDEAPAEVCWLCHACCRVLAAQ
jgi:hypothetical protein